MTSTQDSSPSERIGSFFSWPDGYLSGQGIPGYDDPATVLVNSGRTAIFEALRLLNHEAPITRVLLPSYYCEVVAEYLRPHFEVRTYQSNPLACDFPAELAPDEALVVVSYFGAEPAIHDFDKTRVIVDATHGPFQPWVRNYPARWAASSLRKVVPLGTGGIVTDLSGSEIRQEISSGTATESLDSAMTTTMKQKRDWLNGSASPSKEEWYSGFQSNEVALASLPPQAIGKVSRAIATSFTVDLAEKKREANLEYLRNSIRDISEVEALRGTLGLALVFKTPELAKHVQAKCIAHSIYPARIWPPSRGFLQEDRALSERLLFFHCDFRYSVDAMRFVATVIQRSIEEF